MKIGFPALFACMCLSLTSTVQAGTDYWQEPFSPSPLPATDLMALDGQKPIHLPQAGHRVVLHFWATWCPPCIRELPQIDSFAEQLEKVGVTVIAVSEDQGGAKAVNAFFERHDRPRHMIMALDPRVSFGDSLRVDVLPESLVLDKDGAERARLLGRGQWDSGDRDRLLSYLK